MLSVQQTVKSPKKSSDRSNKVTTFRCPASGNAQADAPSPSRYQHKLFHIGLLRWMADALNPGKRSLSAPHVLVNVGTAQLFEEGNHQALPLGIDPCLAMLSRASWKLPDVSKQHMSMIVGVCAAILNLTHHRATTVHLLGLNRQIQAPCRRIWRSSGSEGLASLPYSELLGVCGPK